MFTTPGKLKKKTRRLRGLTVGWHRPNLKERQRCWTRR
jgi:hypothetical protein